jgi:AraC family transcriptional regulator, transcriptional activator of pobA
MVRDITNFYAYRLQDAPPLEALPLLHSAEAFYSISFLQKAPRCRYLQPPVRQAEALLVFFHSQMPHIPCDARTGFFCMFKASFLTPRMQENLRALPMFDRENTPAYALLAQHERYLTNVFENITEAMQSDYAFRTELLQNYIFELFHYALKLQPSIYHG